MLSNFTSHFNKKREGSIAGPSQVYARNASTIIESFGFSVIQTAEFCATMRERTRNSQKNVCKIGRGAAEALS